MLKNLKNIYSGPTTHPRNLISSVFRDFEDIYIGSNLKNVCNVYKNLKFVFIIY